MVAQLAEEKFSIFGGCFLQAACVGVVEWLSLDSMVISQKSLGTVLHVTSLVIKERFLFGILRLHERMNIDQVFPMRAIAHLCEVCCSALGEQSWFSYECNEVM